MQLPDDGGGGEGRRQRHFHGRRNPNQGRRRLLSPLSQVSLFPYQRPIFSQIFFFIRLLWRISDASKSDYLHLFLKIAIFHMRICVFLFVWLFGCIWCGYLVLVCPGSQWGRQYFKGFMRLLWEWEEGRKCYSEWADFFSKKNDEWGISGNCTERGKISLGFENGTYLAVSLVVYSSWVLREHLSFKVVKV